MIKYLSNKLMGELKMQIIVKNGNKETIYELIYDKETIKQLIDDIVKNCSIRKKSRYVVNAVTIEEAKEQINSSMFCDKIKIYKNVKDIRTEKINDSFDYWRPGDPRPYSFEAEALVVPELVYYLMDILNESDIDYNWFKNRKELTRKEKIQLEKQKIDAEINKISNFDTENKIRKLNDLKIAVEILNDIPNFNKDLLAKYYDIAESYIKLELVQETIKYQKQLPIKKC